MLVEENTRAPVKEHIKAAAVRGIYTVLALLPLPVIQWLGAGLGRLLWWGQSRLAQTTRINIGLCFPALSAAEQLALAKKSLSETGKMILETGACWRWPYKKMRQLIHRVEGVDLFAAACADKRGLVLLVPHLGNWEVLPALVTEYTDYIAMYRPPKMALLDSWVQQGRNRESTATVPTNRRGVAELMKALKNGKCIVVLPDQEPERSGGDFAPFFGIEALTISLVHGLVTKTDAQVLVLNSKRLPHGGGFDMVFRDGNAINTVDLRTSLTAMNAIIETAICEVPAQYQWEYKRFKRRPERQIDFYC